MAGLGECCSHVASVLWAIESGVRIRDSMTITQKKAYWVIPNAVETVFQCSHEHSPYCLILQETNGFLGCWPLVQSDQPFYL